MTTLAVEFINAFTEQVFQGNPAAVVVTDTWLDDELMQNIATEHNLSETAFVVKNAQGVFDIRWFSPLTEIDFCGHATLASAFSLFQRNSASNTLTFFAKAVGKIKVEQLADGKIEMNFPCRPPEKITQVPSALFAGLSEKPDEVYLNQQAYFAVFNHESSIRALTAKSELLKTLAPYDVIVTAKSDTPEQDFVSRYFWPANGGDEDPVTGSAHTGLAPFWAKKLNKNTLVAYQASKRGGKLYCHVKGERVFISGYAVQYLSGNINAL